MKNVLYYFLDHKKINGTLFYCFEYFVLGRSLGQNIQFTIFNISEQDLEFVKAVFRDRYNFDNSYLDHISGIRSVHQLYQIETAKTLILDIHTFKRLYMFLRNDIICYSNEGHEMVRSHEKKIQYYGFYPYQKFDHQVRLKLNFDIFKPLQGEVEKNLLISSLNFCFKDLELPSTLEHKPILYKTAFGHHQNLFNNFDTLFYLHTDFDTNNRLIPESFFYGKEVYIKSNPRFDDSILRRFNDIKENGLLNYWLKEDDKMLNDFLS